MWRYIDSLPGYIDLRYLGVIYRHIDILYKDVWIYINIYMHVDAYENVDTRFGYTEKKNVDIRGKKYAKYTRIYYKYAKYVDTRIYYLDI